MSRSLRIFSRAACALGIAWAAAVWLSAAALRADELASVIVPSFTAFAERDDVPDEPPAVPDCETSALGAEDELWCVSSRSAGHAPDGSIRLHYWRYDGAGHWQTQTLEDFTSADPALPTCFLVHGNRLTPALANCSGWTYFTTFTNGVCKQRPPLRFVIFSWPSERCGRRNADDVRAKAVRAECHAFYLAWLLDRLSPAARISTIGYSYGCRLLGGAFHLLGGGCLRGQQLTNRLHPEPRRIRAIFLAAALDDDHLLPGRAFSEAPTQIDRLLVARNGADPALKWYPLLYGFRLRVRSGQEAMGYAGFAGLHCVPQLHGRVETRDVTCLVGRIHEWHAYEFLCGSFLERMRQYVWFEEL